MKMLYEFHPLAARELDEAVSYYEEVVPGKGLELLQHVRETIRQICEFPESAPITRGHIRSAVIQPSSRWHFTLHYRVKSDYIRILSVAHQTRQPFYWLGRQ